MTTFLSSLVVPPDRIQAIQSGLDQFSKQTKVTASCDAQAISPTLLGNGLTLRPLAITGNKPIDVLLTVLASMTVVGGVVILAKITYETFEQQKLMLEAWQQIQVGMHKQQFDEQGKMRIFVELESQRFELIFYKDEGSYNIREAGKEKVACEYTTFTGETLQKAICLNTLQEIQESIKQLDAKCRDRIRTITSEIRRETNKLNASQQTHKFDRGMLSDKIQPLVDAFSKCQSEIHALETHKTDLDSKTKSMVLTSPNKKQHEKTYKEKERVLAESMQQQKKALSIQKKVDALLMRTTNLDSLLKHHQALVEARAALAEQHRLVRSLLANQDESEIIEQIRKATGKDLCEYNKTLKSALACPEDWFSQLEQSEAGYDENGLYHSQVLVENEHGLKTLKDKPLAASSHSPLAKQYLFQNAFCAAMPKLADNLSALTAYKERVLDQIHGNLDTGSGFALNENISLFPMDQHAGFEGDPEQTSPPLKLVDGIPTALTDHELQPGLEPSRLLDRANSSSPSDSAEDGGNTVVTRPTPLIRNTVGSIPLPTHSQLYMSFTDPEEWSVDELPPPSPVKEQKEPSQLSGSYPLPPPPPPSVNMNNQTFAGGDSGVYPSLLATNTQSFLQEIGTGNSMLRLKKPTDEVPGKEIKPSKKPDHSVAGLIGTAMVRRFGAMNNRSESQDSNTSTTSTGEDWLDSRDSTSVGANGDLGKNSVGEQDSNIYDEELDEDFVDALDSLPDQQSPTPIPRISIVGTQIGYVGSTAEPIKRAGLIQRANSMLDQFA